MYRIGIDIGGTFTDLAAVDEAGVITVAKAPSTPDDPARGLLEGLHALAEQLGTDRADVLARTERIVHGTTVATNALLEHKGARVAMLTTAGHRDVIEMREGLKDDRYNVRMAPPLPLVPRHRRLAVDERLRFDGSVEVALTEETLSDVIDQLDRLDVDAIAVCYLHSYANDEHEQATADVIRRRLPDVYVSLSSHVLPQIKEYERFWTTVVNAYVGPIVSGYLRRLGGELRSNGYEGEVLVMHSHGGVASIEETIQLAAGVVLSGPAGGIAAATVAAKLVDEPDLITFDMGGTSTDISLVRGGAPQFTADKQVGLAKVSLPTIDIHTLGAGGGSIAWVSGGLLRVGPESAGANPGPACYGSGGERPTVTDANVVLGLIDPTNFLGGRVRLDDAAAKRAVGTIAAELGTSVVEAAAGISRVVSTEMAEGIRVVSVRRGVDPRHFSLISFGGAAGLHITEVARLLDIKRVIIPNVAAVLSAWGMLATDLRAELIRSHLCGTDPESVRDIRQILETMEVQGRSRLPDFQGAVDVHPSLDMRYGEQIYEINVPLKGVDLTSVGAGEELIELFNSRHEELYAYSAPGQEIVIVNARQAVVGRLPELRPTAAPRLDGAIEAEPVMRRCHIGKWIEIPVFELDAVYPGQRVEGPALVEGGTTTVLIRDGEVAVGTDHGWLDITVR